MEELKVYKCLGVFYDIRCFYIVFVILLYLCLYVEFVLVVMKFVEGVGIMWL